MKFSNYVDRTELAAFFRRLADALENGGGDELACVEGFSKMKIGVKDEYGRLELKVRIKSPDVCDQAVGDDESSGRLKYKDLKKRMKSSFKMLVKMIHEEETPPAQAVESFLADAALMVTYPGYGDEYYAAFSQSCDAFRAAFESGDIRAMHRTIDVLVHEKSRCHAQYD